jgi:GAF domain-containing protein/HAMP domain-containing protein
MDENKQMAPTNDDAVTPKGFWGTLALVGVSILLCVYLAAALFGQTSASSVSFAIVVFLVAATINLISLVLVLRHQQKLGLRISFYTLLSLGILSVALFQGRALTASFSVLVIASLSIWQLFPRRSWRWPAVFTALSMLMMGAIEWVNPAWRVSIEVGQAGPAAAVLFGLIFLVWAVRLAWQGSLRTKLIVAFLMAALIPLAVISYFNDANSRAALTEDANTALLSAASTTASQLDQFMLLNLDFVRAEAQLPAIVEYLELPASQRAGSEQEARARKFITALTHQDPVYIDSIAVYDLAGNTLLDTYTSDIGLSKSSRDWFNRPIETGLPFVSNVEFSETTGAASIYFAGLVRDDAGKSIGVFRVRYLADILQDLISSNNNLLGPGSFAVLMDGNTHVRLAHGTSPSIIFKSVVPLDLKTVGELQTRRLLPPGTPEQLSTNLPGFETALNNYQTQPFFVTELAVANDQQLEQGAIVTLKTQNWHVIYALSQESFLAPINAQARANLILALVIALVVAGFAVLVSVILAGPITRLTQTAEKIASGDINLQARVESRDEIGILAGTFNRMTQQLRDFISTLEVRVADRTRNLELAAEVGRTVSQVRALDVMLTDAAEIIRSRFDLYYVQVYLVDSSQTNLVLQSGTGSVGAELIGRKHHLPLNTASINGRAAVEKHAVVIADTAASAAFKPNPLLSETRSEMAVPLLVGEKVVGVLDMQSRQAGALSQDVLPAFEALAGQLAIAIQNATLLAETNEARAEVEAQARRLSRANWTDYLDAIHQPEELGFAFAQNEITPLTQAEPVQENALAAPITVTGEALGNLVVEMGAESPIARTDELVNAVARQVAQQIENLRLLESAERYRYEADQASRRITREGWQGFVQTRAVGSLGYLYDSNQVKPHDRPQPDSLALPLKVRGETIGQLSVQGLDRNDLEAFDLANAVAERLGAHIESLRLSQQTEQFAQREQALRQITSTVRGSTDPATILRAAAHELGTLLGRKTIIRLTPAVSNLPNSSPVSPAETDAHKIAADSSVNENEPLPPAVGPETLPGGAE